MKSAWRYLGSKESTVSAVIEPRNREIRARWDTDELDSARRSLGEEDLGANARWADMVSRFRPILSYAELGAIMSARPSELFDQIDRIIGLQDFVDAEGQLSGERVALTAQKAELKVAKQQLLGVLGESSSDSAELLGKRVNARSHDFAVIDALAQTLVETGDDRQARRVIALFDRIPEFESAVAELANALEALRSNDQGEEADAIDLLRAALRLRERPSITCPVCETGELDEGWQAAAAERVRRWDAMNAQFNGLLSTLNTLARHLGGWLGDLEESDDISPEVAQVLGEWSVLGWASPRTLSAAAVNTAAQRVIEVLADVAPGAREVIAQHEETLAPFRDAYGRWREAATAVASNSARLKVVTDSLAWLNQRYSEARAVQLRAIETRSVEFWEQLGIESDLSISGLEVTGASGKPNRRARLTVSTNGNDSLAQAVASQGEQHALALALYLPRVEASGNPFGFVVIDDPVQALDQLRVDGLVRVLSEVAQTKQVIVFTHDDRLMETAFRLGFEPTAIRLQRKVEPGSLPTVSVRKRVDPIEERLGEARAILSDKAVNESARASAAVQLCDSAAEHAIRRAAERRRLSEGRALPAGLSEKSSKLDWLSFVATGQVDKEFAKSARSLGGSWSRYVSLSGAFSENRHRGGVVDAERIIRETSALIGDLGAR
jgi:hypothetical protein